MFLLKIGKCKYNIDDAQGKTIRADLNAGKPFITITLDFSGCRTAIYPVTINASDILLLIGPDNGQEIELLENSGHAFVPRMKFTQSQRAAIEASLKTMNKSRNFSNYFWHAHEIQSMLLEDDGDFDSADQTREDAKDSH
jgi:hypothetical protein